MLFRSYTFYSDHQSALRAAEEKHRAEAARQAEEKQRAEAARQAEEKQQAEAALQSTGDKSFDLANEIAREPHYTDKEKELLAQISDPQQRAMAELRMFMEKQALLATTLSNIANTRHEMRKNVEKGLRGGDEAGIIKVLGLTLSGITPELKKRFSLAEPSTGVIVVEVVKNSEAAAKDVRPGDIIVEVNTPADLSAKINAAKKNGQKSILLSVKRRHDLRFVALHPD